MKRWLLTVLLVLAAFATGQQLGRWERRAIEVVIHMETPPRNDAGAIGGDVCGQPWTICWKTA